MPKTTLKHVAGEFTRCSTARPDFRGSPEGLRVVACVLSYESKRQIAGFLFLHSLASTAGGGTDRGSGKSGRGSGKGGRGPGEEAAARPASTQTAMALPLPVPAAVPRPRSSTQLEARQMAARCGGLAGWASRWAASSHWQRNES